MSEAKKCGNCGADMRCMGREELQLGRTSFIFGDWPNLLAGSLEVELWECLECGKLEFYRGGGPREEEGHMAQTVCPECGAQHDLDDPKCPRCGAKNPNL